MMKKSLLLVILCLLTATLLAQDNSESEEDKNGDNRKVVYSLGFNAWIGSENDDLSNTPVAEQVSTASYNIQLTYKFTTSKSNKWLPFANYTQMYVSLRALRFASNINDGTWEWAENLRAIGVVYGNRYFLNTELKGLNLGWYAGAAAAKSEGYEWQSGFPNTVYQYSEQLIIPLVAAELNYHFAFSYFFLEPSFTVYYNTSAEDVEWFPSIIVGLQLN